MGFRGLPVYKINARPFRKATVNISKTAVTETPSGFEQELKYGSVRPRREIFVGRTRKELDRMVTERCRELERQ
jgi:hypothetical protein